MRMILMTILGSLFSTNYGLPSLESHSDCISGCSEKYKQVNITQYVECLEHCCVNQSRSFTMLFIIIAMTVTGLSYCLYMRRKPQNDHSGYYHSMA